MEATLEESMSERERELVSLQALLSCKEEELMYLEQRRTDLRRELEDKLNIAKQGLRRETEKSRRHPCKPIIEEDEEEEPEQEDYSPQNEEENAVINTFKTGETSSSSDYLLWLVDDLRACPAYADMIQQSCQALSNLRAETEHVLSEIGIDSVDHQREVIKHLEASGAEIANLQGGGVQVETNIIPEADGSMASACNGTDSLVEISTGCTSMSSDSHIRKGTSEAVEVLRSLAPTQRFRPPTRQGMVSERSPAQRETDQKSLAVRKEKATSSCDVVQGEPVAEPKRSNKQVKSIPMQRTTPSSSSSGGSLRLPVRGTASSSSGGSLRLPVRGTGGSSDTAMTPTKTSFVSSDGIASSQGYPVPAVIATGSMPTSGEGGYPWQGGNRITSPRTPDSYLNLPQSSRVLDMLRHKKSGAIQPILQAAPGKRKPTVPSGQSASTPSRSARPQI